MSKESSLHPRDEQIIRRIIDLNPKDRQAYVQSAITSIDERMVSTFDTGDAFQKDIAFRNALENVL